MPQQGIIYEAAAIAGFQKTCFEIMSIYGSEWYEFNIAEHYSFHYT